MYTTVSSHQYFPYYQPMPPSASGRSSSHAGVVWLHGKTTDNLNVPKKPEAQSAPVMASHDRPFTDMYRHTPVSSHSELCQSPMREDDNSNRMMFSTTKEHTILPPSPRGGDLSPFSVSPNDNESKRHSVQLSITPSFPFQQQQANVYNSSVSAKTSHSSRLGRHTTSLNFQLQPASDQYPLEISTVPTGIGQPSNPQDFGSHVQISVGSQGTTFTALRLQCPQSQQQSKQHSMQLSPSEHASFSKFPDSSQGYNPKLHSLPGRHKINHSTKGCLAEISEVHGETECGSMSNAVPGVLSFEVPRTDFPKVKSKKSSKHSNAQFSMPYGFQQSSAYIQDVINHQKARLDLVLQELKKDETTCTSLKAEVNSMEQEVSQTRLKKSSFSYAAELQKLREENRKLQIECNCLLMEVDLCSTGQIPLGVTDEDFYSNIFTGPTGTITPLKKNEQCTNAENANPTTVKQVSISSPEDDDEDERNRWTCKKCTFANHPALEKCEICELPRCSGSFFDDG